MKNVPHTVTDAAIATIRERIETSVYPVGSLLPAQRQLSEELAISRAYAACVLQGKVFSRKINVSIRPALI